MRRAIVRLGAVRVCQAALLMAAIGLALFAVPAAAQQAALPLKRPAQPTKPESKKATSSLKSTVKMSTPMPTTTTPPTVVSPSRT